MKRISEVSSEFINYWLKSPFFLEQLERGNGATVDTLTIEKLSSVELTLPPHPEQRRIVGILDEALAGIAAAKAHAERNRQNARALFESHLHAVFSHPGLGWTEAVLGNLFEIGSSKRVLKSQWKTEGVPFYRGREITRLSADGFVHNELFISEEHFAALAKQSGVPGAGDIVITAIGTIGNTHIVRSSDRFYFKDASVLWMKRTSDVRSEFIQFWLKSPMFFEQLDRGNGATVDTLTIQKLQNMRLQLPSSALQQRIVRQLDALAAETRRLEGLYERKAAALDELKRSLLHQAFSGQL
jgi:type I restriction enzyme S subunit